MITPVQISFLDHIELIGPEDHWALISPKDVAQRFNFFLEMSYDNLGRFEFVGVKLNDVAFGFRRYLYDVTSDYDNERDNFSLLKVIGAEEDDTIPQIQKLLDLPKEKIQKLPNQF